MDIDKSKLSPMMQHYLSMKEQAGDTILFYRLGDFYEMFFDDAVRVSKELELTLTGRDCGLEERAPMCGIPYHAAETYISRLINKGYKVAICEQVEDPKQAKGLVKREIIKVITPGTSTGDSTLKEDRNNYIMCLSSKNDAFGITTADVSTGEFLTTSVKEISKIMDEIQKFSPSEIVIEDVPEFKGKDFRDTFAYLAEHLHITESSVPENYYNYKKSLTEIEEQFHVSGAEAIGLRDYAEAISSSGALLGYLKDTQMDSLMQINHIKVYHTSKYMIIDSTTRRNLELTETMRDKEKRGSLLWVLDKTKTAMGARLLRNYIEMPLLDMEEITRRQDCVEQLNVNIMARDEMREYLNSIYDLERLMTKISIKTAGPRDLLAFKTSLQYLPYIKNIMSEMSCDMFQEMAGEFDVLADLYQLIDAAIDEDAPITIREGGIFKTGYSEDIDNLKNIKANSKQLLAQIENDEREKTGIKTLKIKFNHVFGYFFDVTNSFKDKVPDYFIRKQTLTNSERFTTDELMKLSDMILGSEDKLYNLEYEEYVRLRESLAKETERVQATAHTLAVLDVFASLSYVAVKNNFVRPGLNDKGIIDIKEGRHPVVEMNMPENTFIPNDTYLDSTTNRIMIITGPNMAGKSTYMRQTAIIALMAQIGSFVPATSADISISDRIFTRVGASDDLAQGQSTFMVEMSEVSNILRNATKDSLIIMDEIGRGTSTFDGLSIAWAVVEYIADKKSIGAKTLFATHYHELTELEGKLSSVNNYSIAIKQSKDQLIFLRKIVRGGMDRSYGIEVASLAGLPQEVISRAKEISEFLAEEDITGKAKDLSVAKPSSEKKSKKSEEDSQLSLFGDTTDMSIMADLKSLDIDNMTPVKALLFLQDLKGRLNND